MTLQDELEKIDFSNIYKFEYEMNGLFRDYMLYCKASYKTRNKNSDLLKNKMRDYVENQQLSNSDLLDRALDSMNCDDTIYNIYLSDVYNEELRRRLANTGFFDE